MRTILMLIALASLAGVANAEPRVVLPPTPAAQVLRDIHGLRVPVPRPAVPTPETPTPTPSAQAPTGFDQATFDRLMTPGTLENSAWIDLHRRAQRDAKTLVDALRQGQ